MAGKVGHTNGIIQRGKLFFIFIFFLIKNLSITNDPYKGWHIFTCHRLIAGWAETNSKKSKPTSLEINELDGLNGRKNNHKIVQILEKLV